MCPSLPFSTYYYIKLESKITKFRAVVLTEHIYDDLIEYGTLLQIKLLLNSILYKVVQITATLNIY